MGPAKWNVCQDFPRFLEVLVFSLFGQFTWEARDFTASESGNIFTCPTYLCTISLPNSLRQTAYVKGWKLSDYWSALNHWWRTPKHIRVSFKLWQTIATCCRSLLVMMVEMYLWAGLHSEHGVDIPQRKSLSVNCADRHGPVIRGVPGDYDDKEDYVF